MRAFLFLLAAGLWLGLLSDAQPRATIEDADEVLELKIGAAVKVKLASPMKTAFISSPKVAGYQVITEREMIVFGQKLGRTAVFVMDDFGKTIWSAKLEVVPDLSKVKRALEDEYPEFDITVEAAANGNVVLSGSVPDAVTATDVIGLVEAFLAREQRQTDAGADGDQQGADGSQQAGGDERSAGEGEGVVGERFGRVVNRLVVTGGGQVSIKVRFAEVKREIIERLGLQWQNLRFSVDSTEFGFQQSPIFGTVPADLLPGEANKPTSPSDLAGLIDVLAQENFVSVLAEPNLSVASGETASFLSGGEIPFPTYADGSPNIEFRPFGVLLDVTPTVLADNRISLRIRPEVSEPSAANGVTIGGITYPGLSIRRADTTVELASGQSFALAGLLKADLTDTVSKFPFLGDIPLIGALVRSSEFKRGDSELVIIATASIAGPTNEILAIPNENIELEGPIARLFLGHTYVPKSAVPQGFMY